LRDAIMAPRIFDTCIFPLPVGRILKRLDPIGEGASQPRRISSAGAVQVTARQLLSPV
jgi:hypothetical protein